VNGVGKGGLRLRERTERPASRSRKLPVEPDDAESRKKVGDIPAFIEKFSQCDFLAISDGGSMAHTLVNNQWLPAVERGGRLE
jgi:hypothetical protein